MKAYTFRIVVRAAIYVDIFKNVALEKDEIKIILHGEDITLLVDWQKKIALFRSQIIEYIRLCILQ